MTYRMLASINSVLVDSGKGGETLSSFSSQLLDQNGRYGFLGLLRTSGRGSQTKPFRLGIFT
jgi:hypothetical protein